MNIKKLLQQLKSNKISSEEAYIKLKNLAYEDLGFAKVDHHRTLRKGFPEVIFCQGKTPEQVAQIAKRIKENGQDVLGTRAKKEHFKAVKKILPRAVYNGTAHIILAKQAQTASCKLQNKTKLQTTKSKILIVTAGTADMPVAEEAVVTLEFLGHQAERLYDVGVAGIHRLLKNLKQLQAASVIIAVAGMEGALPSVIGGLVDCPVIAVPTSVGYGASFKGLAALLTMLNSCAPGVAVVNIDNGFGAAIMAHHIIRINAPAGRFS